MEKLLTRADTGVGEGSFDSVAWIMEKIGLEDAGVYQSAVMTCVNEDSPTQVDFYYLTIPNVKDQPAYRWIAMKSECPACGDKGWLLADNSDHGLRVERCDACKRFVCDEEAVTYVATLAETRDEVEAVIASSAVRVNHLDKPQPVEILKTVYVKVSLAVGMAYDEEPTLKQVRMDAIRNFMDHPALKNSLDLEGFIDSIQIDGGPDITSLPL